MTSTLYLVRHGETEWSRTGRHTGTTDLPLTEAGEATAHGLAHVLADLDPSLVLTSPRLRARRTAALAGYGEAQVEDDLAEWDYGDYEGLTTPQIREQVPDWTVWSHPVPGGESAEDVATRLDRVVDRVRSVDGTSLVFAHGHSLRALTARWLDLPVAEGRHFHLDTATSSVLGDDRGQSVVLRWNVPARG
ncbi:histidine phosphatase family protein [Aeromicrobium sp. CF4.19]|uniref:histidine phosphatase family protein n=1 Tax=Aeromicrobium sp. CF4.19 TaxID=3373082 RepID=UPI003EE59ACC